MEGCTRDGHPSGRFGDGSGYPGRLMSDSLSPLGKLLAGLRAALAEVAVKKGA